MNAKSGAGDVAIVYPVSKFDQSTYCWVVGLYMIWGRPPTDGDTAPLNFLLWDGESVFHARIVGILAMDADVTNQFTRSTEE